MTYKARQCFVVMRQAENSPIPVAVFYDLETAEGNAEGYNLTMEENGIEGVNFYVEATAAYE